MVQEGITGRLVNEYDPEELAQVLTSLLGDVPVALVLAGGERIAAALPFGLQLR